MTYKERLDQVLRKYAWMDWTESDCNVPLCQLKAMDDEGEELVILSGERFFTTVEKAIDAAIQIESGF